jgi:hypothetical protein
LLIGYLLGFLNFFFRHWNILASILSILFLISSFMTILLVFKYDPKRIGIPAAFAFIVFILMELIFGVSHYFLTS